MNVFLDAQIWLSIYDFSSDNLEQFSKLKELADKDVTILLTEQIWDEVLRNRENKIKDALNKFKEINIQIPNLCKGYEEYKTLENLLSEIQAVQRGLLKKIGDDIVKNNLHADALIIDIFKKSTYYLRDVEIINKAKLRYDIGNPPGKDKSYGDAINWELLLKNVPEGKDLFFISSDKDYKSVLDENKFNQYLFTEWKNSKESNLFFYKSLTEFFKLHLKHIELKTETNKNELIQQLVNSASFAKTHKVISQLSIYANYSDEQIIQLLKAAELNSQIWAIIDDPDIKTFFESLLKNKIENFIDKPEFNQILHSLGYKTKIGTSPNKE